VRDRERAKDSKREREREGEMQREKRSRVHVHAPARTQALTRHARTHPPPTHPPSTRMMLQIALPLLQEKIPGCCELMTAATGACPPKHTHHTPSVRHGIECVRWLWALRHVKPEP